MWLATTRGFYSAVSNRTDAASIMVRARSHADLVQLTELAEQLNQPIGEIVQTLHADYPYRLSVTRHVWQVLLVGLADEINYGNFKDAVALTNPDRSHHTYLRVWSALREIEHEHVMPTTPTHRRARKKVRR